MIKPEHETILYQIRITDSDFTESSIVNAFLAQNNNNNNNNETFLNTMI